MEPSEANPPRYSARELVRMGFWLSGGALVVFPIVAFLVAMVVIFVLAVLGYS